MFQNEQIAAQRANDVVECLINKGVAPAVARERAERFRKLEIAQMNRWTAENVGLD